LGDCVGCGRLFLDLLNLFEVEREKSGMKMGSMSDLERGRRFLDVFKVK
jgi:hypothetical protein